MENKLEVLEALEDANIFAQMGRFWSEIADDRPTERQIRFLKNQLNGEGYILDLACGTGRHVIPLRNEGYTVVGLDVSVKLLRIGKRRDGGAMLVCGDMRFLPFIETTFSAAISMDTSIGYLPTKKEDLDSVSETRRVLRRDGIFIVDVFNSIRLAAKYQDKVPVKKSIEYPSFYLKQDRQLTSDGKLLNDTWTIRSKAEGETRVFKHIVRLYDFNELFGFLESTGFAVKRVFGDYEEQDFSADSSRLIVVATAR